MSRIVEKCLVKRPHYEVVSAVHHQQVEVDEREQQHFIAFVKRNHRWWKVDDLNKVTLGTGESISYAVHVDQCAALHPADSTWFITTAFYTHTHNNPSISS